MGKSNNRGNPGGGYVGKNSGASNHRGSKHGNAGRVRGSKSDNNGKSGFASREMRKAVYITAMIPLGVVAYVLIYFGVYASGGS